MKPVNQEAAMRLEHAIFETNGSKMVAEKKKGVTATAVTPWFYWCRGTESNCRHGDFQWKSLLTQSKKNDTELNKYTPTNSTSYLPTSNPINTS